MDNPFLLAWWLGGTVLVCVIDRLYRKNRWKLLLTANAQHGAAQVFGINFSTLQNHIAMQNRSSFTDAKQTEALIVAALEFVAEKRLSVFSAAKLYGIAYRTLSGKTGNLRNQSKQYRFQGHGPRWVFSLALSWLIMVYSMTFPSK